MSIEEGVTNTVDSRKEVYSAFGESTELLQTLGENVTLSDITRYLKSEKDVARHESDELEKQGEAADERDRKHWAMEATQLENACTQLENGNSQYARLVISSDMGLEEAQNRFIQRRIVKVENGEDTTYLKWKKTKESDLEELQRRLHKSNQTIAAFKSGLRLLGEQSQDTSAQEVVDIDSPKDAATQFKKLSPSEQTTQIKAMADRYSVRSSGKTNGYYFFGMQGIVGENPKHLVLLKQVGENSNTVLSSEEEKVIYEGEKGQFKINLAVPESERMNVCERIMTVYKADAKIAHEIIDEKEARRAAGENIIPSATSPEMLERGAQAVRIIDWKMKHFGAGSDDTRLPDFVFYVTPEVGQPEEEAAAQTAQELGDILSGINLTSAESSIPRYSMPVMRNGEAVPGLFIAQGNGDFKDYLMRTGGEEKLARFYDKERNYAVRKETQLVI